VAQAELPEPQYPVIDDDPPQADDVDIEAADVEIEAAANGTAYSPQGCCFCQRTEADDVIVDAYPQTVNGPVVCAQCVERLVDAVRAELPRRRLRLAMERLAAGTVSIEMVEAVERLAGQVKANE
jgi:hypothetical protein